MKTINKILRTIFFPIYWIKETREEVIAMRRLLGTKVVFDLENNPSIPDEKKEELLDAMLRCTPKYISKTIIFDIQNDPSISGSKKKELLDAISEFAPKYI